MPKPVPNTYGPFTKGVITAIAATLLGTEGCVSATGVDLSDGTLRGTYGPGSTVATLSANQKFAHYVANAAWVGSTDPQWGVNGSKLTISNVDYDVSYYTYSNVEGSGSNWFPKMRLGSNTYDLGLPGLYYSNTVTITDGAGAAGERSFAVTFYSPTTDTESNPSRRVAATKRGAVIDIDTYGDIHSGTIHRRIYATREGDPNGTLYYYDTVTNDTDATWTDTGGASTDYSIDDTLDLDWGVGGSINEDDTPFDHTEPPYFTVLAESFHSVDDSDGSGVLFGAAQGGIVAWCMKGNTRYWPTVQRHTLPEEVVAIISAQGQTYVFTQNGCWSFSGAADYAIYPTKTGAAFGIPAGMGHTAKETPLGVVFVSRQGLAVFDGSATRILTDGILAPEFFNEYDYGTAAYYDGFYFLSFPGQEKVWRFDLRNPGNIKVTSEALDVSAFHVTEKVNSGIGMTKASLYIVERTTGNIRPWRPADQDQDGALSRQAWSLKTGDNTCGDQARPKRFVRVNARGTGTLSLRFYLDGAATPAFTKSRAGLFWLPSHFVGRSLAWEAVSSDGTGVLYSIDIQTEVLDGA